MQLESLKKSKKEIDVNIYDAIWRNQYEAACLDVRFMDIDFRFAKNFFQFGAYYKISKYPKPRKDMCLRLFRDPYKVMQKTEMFWASPAGKVVSDLLESHLLKAPKDNVKDEL